MSLANAPAMTTIRVTDLEKARDFYGNKLGLKEIGSMMESQDVMFEAGNGTKIYIYQGPPSHAEHTLASFKVDDVLATVNELKGEGIAFETYDMDPIKTDENNIATFGEYKAAWFKDPDGNILALGNN